MDMKNTVILLILLLSIVGLMIGVSYTYDSTSLLNPDGYEETVTEDDNGTIFIHLEKKENEPSLVDRISNIGKSDFNN